MNKRTIYYKHKCNGIRIRAYQFFEKDDTPHITNAEWEAIKAIIVAIGNGFWSIQTPNNMGEELQESWWVIVTDIRNNAINVSTVSDDYFQYTYEEI